MKGANKILCCSNEPIVVVVVLLETIKFGGRVLLVNHQQGQSSKNVRLPSNEYEHN